MIILYLFIICAFAMVLWFLREERRRNIIIKPSLNELGKCMMQISQRIRENYACMEAESTTQNTR